jgi:hypothetical protein
MALRTTTDPRSSPSNVAAVLASPPRPEVTQAMTRIATKQGGRAGRAERLQLSASSSRRRGFPTPTFPQPARANWHGDRPAVTDGPRPRPAGLSGQHPEAQASCRIVRRDQLGDSATYGGTLLHELTHAVSGSRDLTFEFEEALTAHMGTVARSGLGQPPASPRGPGRAVPTDATPGESPWGQLPFQTGHLRRDQRPRPAGP